MSSSKVDLPPHTEIAARAEQIYRESGSLPGRDLENWVRAENELKKRLAENGATPVSAKSKASTRSPREKQRA